MFAVPFVLMEASSMELALLAAVLDPEGCRAGASRDALLHAMALFEESEALCQVLQPMDRMQRLTWLWQAGRLDPKSGAIHLHTVLAEPILNPPVPVLTLALQDGQGDELRPYLQKHANLEGTTGRKSWSRLRTVQDNLRKWMTWLVNLDNERAIRQQEERDKNEAERRRITVARLRREKEYRAGAQWTDVDEFCADFYHRYAVKVEGELDRYEIPREVVDNFIRWKKEIRRAPGGIGAVRPLSREEILRNLGRRSCATLPRK